MKRRTPGPASGHRRNARPGADRGSVTIQIVILAPVMFLFLFMAVQAGLWFHARSLALGAAMDGARVAAGEAATSGAGAAAAADFLTQGGGDGVLLDAGISGARSATTATVTVTGTAPSVIPGWAPTITQSASLPVERITGTSRGFMDSEGFGGVN